MNIQLNGKSQQAEDGITVADLLRQLNLSSQQVAIEVNLDVVPRDRHATHVLCDGDQLEVVTLVGGG